MYDLQTLLNDFNANRKAAELATSRTFPRGPIKKRQNGSSRAARCGLASKPALRALDIDPLNRVRAPPKNARSCWVKPAEIVHQALLLQRHLGSALRRDRHILIPVSGRRRWATKSPFVDAQRHADVGVPIVSAQYNGTIHDFGLLNALAHVPSTEAAIRQASEGIRTSCGSKSTRRRARWRDRKSASFLDSASRMTGASGASRQRRSTNSRGGSET